MASQFYITYRLKPAASFEEFEGMTINFASGYKLELKNDLAWVLFQANSNDWEEKREEGASRLRSYLSAVTLIKEYPFDMESIQWIEIKGEQPELHCVLGKLVEEPVAQVKTPTVTRADFHKASVYATLAEFNDFFRIAMLDYSLALVFPRESIVFLARALEAIEGHFGQQTRQEGQKKTKSRDEMRHALHLPNKELIKFHKIANDTTLARHAKKLTQFRRPTFLEQRYCIVLCRLVLDRFAAYIWHENRDKLGQEMSLPNGFNPADEFKKRNKSIQELLRRIQSDEI